MLYKDILDTIVTRFKVRTQVSPPTMHECVLHVAKKAMIIIYGIMMYMHTTTKQQQPNKHRLFRRIPLMHK